MQPVQASSLVLSLLCFASLMLAQHEATSALRGEPAASRALAAPASSLADHSWSPIDSSGPREILNIVEKKIQDGSIGHARKPDKFWRNHAYQQMYGMYLLPYVELHHRQAVPMKFLEIGLGCVDGRRSREYSSFFSGLTIWKEIFDLSRDQLWMGEYDHKCVENVRANSDYLNGVNIVTGDQGDVETLKRWISETGGNFDIVIDDGAHLNTRIYNSFVELWPEVKPGGLYFIEDLQVVRKAPGLAFGDDSMGKYVMADVIRDWIDQLMIPLRSDKELPSYLKHRLPPGVKWITCQMEACVIAKAEVNDVARSSQ